MPDEELRLVRVMIRIERVLANRGFRVNEWFMHHKVESDDLSFDG